MRTDSLKISLWAVAALLGLNLVASMWTAAPVADGERRPHLPSAGTNHSLVVAKARGNGEEVLFVYDHTEQKLAAYVYADGGIRYRGVRKLDYDFLADEYSTGDKADVSRAELKEIIARRLSRQSLPSDE